MIFKEPALQKLYTNPDITFEELDASVRAIMELDSNQGFNSYGLSKAALHRDHLLVLAIITKSCQSLPKLTLKCPDFKSDLKSSKSFGLHVKNCI